MARNTARQRRRQQRRARAQEGDQQGVVQRARSRQQQVRPAAQQVKPQTGSRRVPGGGFRRFVGEAIAELKKVEWPTQSQVIQGTIVVIVACAIVGTYLWGADLIFRPFVRNVLLK